MIKLSNKGLTGVALLLSVITAALVYSYLKDAALSPAEQETVTVLVAKADIPAKTAITPELVQEMKVPVEYVQPGAVTDAEKAVGAVVKEAIVAGEQITQRRLTAQGKAAGFSGIIPKDKRAVTVAVTEVTGVAGFVKPGDFVDVIVTFDANTAGADVSHVVLQNMQVLAANQDTNGAVEENADAKTAAKDAVKMMTVTLAAAPDEAAKLTLSEEKGKIRLALRPFMPQNPVTITQVTTPRDLVGSHTPAIPPSAGGATPAREKASPAEGKGITVIRGTKTESIPIQ